MFKWYRNIKKVLKHEPEMWLSYLKGQKLNELPHLLAKKPRFSGFHFQVLKIPYQMLRMTKPISFNVKNRSINPDFYLFAGSINQISSLQSTILSLKCQKQTVSLTTYENLLSIEYDKLEYDTFYLNFSDVIKSLIVTLIHAPSLYRELNKLHDKAIDYWFSEFCSIYLYLVYFERVLSTSYPKFVITANDHSIPNRCLLAIAHELDIKTVYLQHASVSKLFPALSVDYAFLDGKNALDIYKQCKSNQYENAYKKSNPKIFLSGQKKIIKKHYSCDNDLSKNIGIALNSLDSIDNVLELVKKLGILDFNIFVRWHPAQDEQDILKVKTVTSQYSNVEFSDPKGEVISKFLGKIRYLIAGNSSIHLEAALAKVTPIYYEFSKAIPSDYYGYVRTGLAIRANNFKEIVTLLEKQGFNNKNQINEIRYFSSTYETPWEGREGELVANCLIAIKNKTPLPIEFQTL